jgi:hypothetical protein
VIPADAGHSPGLPSLGSLAKLPCMKGIRQSRLLLPLNRARLAVCLGVLGLIFIMGLLLPAWLSVAYGALAGCGGVLVAIWYALGSSGGTDEP